MLVSVRTAPVSMARRNRPQSRCGQGPNRWRRWRWLTLGVHLHVPRDLVPWPRSDPSAFADPSAGSLPHTCARGEKRYMKVCIGTLVLTQRRAQTGLSQRTVTRPRDGDLLPGCVFCCNPPPCRITYPLLPSHLPTVVTVSIAILIDKFLGTPTCSIG